MPLDLVTGEQEMLQQNKAQAAAAETDVRDPLAIGGRSRAFCEWVLRLTLDGTRTLAAEEFSELASAYDKLEGLERLEVRTQLARSGIHWTSTFESATDGYDDAENGYEAYQQLSAAPPSQAG